MISNIKYLFLIVLCLFSTILSAQDIFEAIIKGEIDTVMKLVEKDNEVVNIANNNNESPLLLSAKHGQADIARFLISKGADVNKSDKKKWAPLHYATWSSEEIVRLLIEKGADVNLQNSAGETPLFNYIYRGNIAMLDYLLSNGADINIKTNRGETPLHHAAGKGNKNLVELLLSHGAQVNALTNFNFTPLHFAAIFGHEEIVKILIDQGAELNIKSNDGGFPLHFAHSARYPKIEEILISKGAKRTIRDYPKLDGKYFGLKKPILTPELFAEKILFNISIFVIFSYSQEQDEIFFSLSSQHFQNSKIWYMKKDKRYWLPPMRALFSSEYSEGSPVLSPDGNRLFFYSNMPKENSEQNNNIDIWYVERNGDLWGKPQNLKQVNTDNIEASPSISKNGNLYFHRFEQTESGNRVFIYRSRYINGQYAIPEKLGSTINNEFGAAGPAIAPDESFIVFHSIRPGGYNPENELFVCFQNKDGTWNDAFNLGKQINSYWSASATISPDGKYLFYISLKDGSYHTYWIDTKIIHALKLND
jgi:ankyrin repeat protein